jgi:RND family efflux transporter MFP subunit
MIGWRLLQQRAQTQALARQRAASSTAPPTVQFAVATVRDIVNSFSATGTIETTQDVKITPKVSGRINYLVVQEGDVVHPGQVLVRIDPAQVEAQVQQQQAAVAEAEYRLTQAQLTQHANDVTVQTQIRQQEAMVANERAAYVQAQRNNVSQVQAAQAAVNDAQAKVGVANAGIANAQAGVNSAQANLINAQASYNRTYTLYKQGYVAAQDVDNARTALNVQHAAVTAAQSQVRSATAARDSAVAQLQGAQQQLTIAKTNGAAAVEAARAQLAQAQAALENAIANQAQTPAYQQNLKALRATVDVARGALANAIAQRADTVLTAPLTGVVTARLQDQGSTASPNQQILEIQALDQVWATIAVPEQVATRLHIGQSAAVSFSTYPGRFFTAHVGQINPAADVQSRLFTVRAILDNTQHLFRPGMFATVTVVTERASHVVAVRREAVQTDANGPYVLVITPAQTVERRQVVRGISDANYIAILQGVHAGERVVTLSSYPLRDGQSVQIGGAGTGSPGAYGAAGDSGTAQPTPAQGTRR